MPYPELDVWLIEVSHVMSTLIGSGSPWSQGEVSHITDYNLNHTRRFYMSQVRDLPV